MTNSRLVAFHTQSSKLRVLGANVKCTSSTCCKV